MSGALCGIAGNTLAYLTPVKMPTKVSGILIQHMGIRKEREM